MSGLISSECESLLDLGFGIQETKELLMRSIMEYWGVDYVNSGSDSIIEEYNQGDFPQVQADAVLCIDCLEYIEDTDSFIRKMCKSSRKEIVLSYSVSEEHRPDRRNHMPIEALKEKFKRNGFHIDTVNKTDDFHYLVKFINIRLIMINTVKWNRLTYLEFEALQDLMEAAAKASELEGCMIEAGCALGGSGICIASEKENDTPLLVYDVFGMIPAPGERDGADVLERYDEIKQGKSQGIGGELYYGYQENLMEKVESSFCTALGIQRLEDAGISLIKGLFQDTITGDSPVAFAHIDCDWHDSVMVCLERIVPRLVRGGILVIDDYDCWSGCRKAIDEYFQNKREDFIFENKSRLHIIKKQLCSGMFYAVIREAIKILAAMPHMVANKAPVNVKRVFLI